MNRNRSGAYQAHADFVALSGETPTLGRVVTAILATGFAFVYVMPVVMLVVDGGQSDPEALFDGKTPKTILIGLFAFLIPFFALAMVLRSNEGLELGTLFGPARKVRESALAAARAVGAVLLLVEVLPPWLPRDAVVEARSVAHWAMLLPVSIFAIGIQVTVEEAFFRGYLQQRLARLYQSAFVWMVLPNVAFGALHIFNAEGIVDGVIWAVFATLIGIAAADLTARHGTLGPAIGLHLVNNMFAFLLFATEDGVYSGLALYVLEGSQSNPASQTFSQLFTAEAVGQILVISLYVGIQWLAVRVALKR